MTIIMSNSGTLNLKKEIRGLHRTAKRIVASKKSALRFLVSTGMYTPSGRLKKQYR